MPWCFTHFYHSFLSIFTYLLIFPLGPWAEKWDIISQFPWRVRSTNIPEHGSLPLPGFLRFWKPVLLPFSGRVTDLLIGVWAVPSLLASLVQRMENASRDLEITIFDVLPVLQVAVSAHQYIILLGRLLQQFWEPGRTGGFIYIWKISTWILKMWGTEVEGETRSNDWVFFSFLLISFCIFEAF